MSKVVLYIAASLDGYIARKNDDISWLDPFQDGTEDYGFATFSKSIGATIMGARTYRQALLFPDRILKGVKNYVVSGEDLARVPGADIEFYHGDLKKLVSSVKNTVSKDIWLVGGGQLVSSFLNEGLIDEAQHFVAPILLKEGIPLYSGLKNEINLNLVETQTYRSGIVKLQYILPV